MIKLLQDAIRAIFEIALLVPMPWRVGLVILTAVLLLYLLVWRLLPWLIERLSQLFLFLSEGIAALLLWPEYLTTNKLRQFGHRPLPGTYAFGDMLQGIVRLIHAGATRLTDFLERQRRISKWGVILAVLIVAVLIPLWYMQPLLDETVAVYIDQGIALWYSLERWALTSEWASPSQAAPVIKPEAATPTPSGNAVTPTSSGGTVKPTSPGGTVWSAPSAGTSTSTPPVGTATPVQANTPRAMFTLTPRPTQTPTATPVHTVYIVQPGDSLSKIAKDFGVSVEDLVAINEVKYPSLVTEPAGIRVGWELLIPE